MGLDWSDPVWSDTDQFENVTQLWTDMVTTRDASTLKNNLPLYPIRIIRVWYCPICVTPKTRRITSIPAVIMISNTKISPILLIIWESKSPGNTCETLHSCGHFASVVTPSKRASYLTIWKMLWLMCMEQISFQKLHSWCLQMCWINMLNFCTQQKNQGWIFTY